MYEKITKTVLEDFTSVELADTATDHIASDQAVITALNTLRNNAREVLKEKSQNLYRITNIFVHNTSVTLLSFSYYNNLDNVDTIQSLNDDLSPTYYSGDVKIIS